MSSKTGNRLLQLNDTNVSDRSTLLLTSQLSTRQMDAKKRESSMISEETQQPLSPQPISAIRSNDSELQFLEDIRQRDNEFRFIDREYKITDSLTLVFDGPCVMYKVIETYDYYYSVYLELVNYKDNVRHGYQFKNDYLNYHSLYFNGQLTSRYQVPQTEPKQIQNVSYLSDEGYSDNTLTPDPDMCYDR